MPPQRRTSGSLKTSSKFIILNSAEKTREMLERRIKTKKQKPTQPKGITLASVKTRLEYIIQHFVIFAREKYA